MLIAGPTASGKSALALRLAREHGGVVINADALQVYSELMLLTARPRPEETGGIPHLLYGEVPPARRFSAGDWARAAKEIIDREPARPLIFVGGTGLYFESLIKGFADVPEVPPEAVAAAEREIAGMDRAERGALIAARDPLIAARLKAPDPQRVARALAVLIATGRSLAMFQDALQRPLLEEFSIEKMVLNPPVAELRQRIATRFNGMLDRGAVEEVRGLLSLGLDPALPAMKAIGVPELSAWLRGEIDDATAVTRAITATHQYAKRQRTWFRGRMADWRWVEA